jgi:methylenetetrahydrofolate reductase (NADPH)
MKLSEVYKSKKPVISFEVFPPKTDEGIDALMGELKELMQFRPSFISVTYGAGGSTQGRSIKVIDRIQKEIGVPPLPHFTCIGSDKASILNFSKVIESMGIESILALRGDPPKDKTNYHPERNVFKYAPELVAFLKEHTSLEIAVAGYPQGHPDTRVLDTDIGHLAEKVQAGAEVVITQLFYDNAIYFRFVDKAREKGIKVPIIPGIMPLTNPAQIEKTITLCGVQLPDGLQKKLQPYLDNKEEFQKIGIAHAVEQVQELLAKNVPGIHFYPLNHAWAVAEVIRSSKL